MLKAACRPYFGRILVICVMDCLCTPSPKQVREYPVEIKLSGPNIGRVLVQNDIEGSRAQAPIT